MIFEEDAEWSMLLGTPHDAITRLLASLPRHWAVVQAAVIAEYPYMRHLHRRLHGASARALSGRHHARRAVVRGGSTGRVLATPPLVPRSSLRGLSWPFTPGREVVENATWLKPYWCATYASRGSTR